ncbi:MULTISPECIES: DUF4209 domain-containing protein [Nocardia]|uniref:DUF4209 domain-containing protein n=1 Tax=Nocardia TaxID=1817 RepID=UPI0024553420|nr:MULTISPECIES: DUF4209 domain-containing protein [Nocardia]
MSSNGTPDAEAQQYPIDIDSYVALWDRLATSDSYSTMALEFRHALSIPYLEPLDSAPDITKAVAWAIDYAIEMNESDGRRRVALIPRHILDDETIPPKVDEVPSQVIDLWVRLSSLVNSPVAKARLFHLLFQRQEGAAPHKYCKNAIEAYIQSSKDWSRELDSIRDLACAIRLSRAIGDKPSRIIALEALLDIAASFLNRDDPLAGIIGRALTYAVEDSDCPDRVDALLEQAASAWSDARRNDHALKLMLRRTTDSAQKESIWERRVDGYLAQAESEDSGILRSVRRQNALELANESGIRDLRSRAAAELQKGRNEQLEFLHFSVSSERYEEEYEALRDMFIKGGSWQEALISFAHSGPLTGNIERNKAHIEEKNTLHPLASLFPDRIYGADGLPVLIATSEEQRFNIDLTRHELFILGLSVRPFTDAWLEIPSRFGMPKSRELIDFLLSWPSLSRDVVGPLVRSMQRSWAGDVEGAAYTIVPWLERQVRDMVLAADEGVYRLQRKETPGQYPGLGFLLPLLAKHYNLDESHQRFLQAIANHPVGLNLRNLMLHGFGDDGGLVTAPLFFHTILVLGSLERNETTADDSADKDHATKDDKTQGNEEGDEPSAPGNN